MHELQNFQSVDTSKSKTQSKEVPASLEPFVRHFLADLQTDYPQLAQEIETQRLPNYLNNVQTLWEEFQEELRSTPNKDDAGVQEILQQAHPDQEFISALIEGLNKLQYISEKETHEIMRGYAAEVEAALTADPTAIVIFETDYDNNNSETYFAKIVHQMLPQALQSRVLFSSDFLTEEMARKLPAGPITIYRFDDSTNSGSQLRTSVKNFINEYHELTDSLTFHIRLIASKQYTGDYIRQKVDDWLKTQDFSQITFRLDFQQKYTNPSIDVLYKGHKVTWGTGVIFSHKIQDNIPNLFVSLSDTHRKDKPHLFKYDVDIKSPYKKDRSS